MLNLAKYCRSPLLSQITKLVGNSSNHSFGNGLVRTYATPIFRRQSLCSKVKISNFLRGKGTVAVRLSSDVSNEGKKAVGYWLLTCSGMLFVEVILGGVTRLTESRLSMATWKLFGEKMPRTEVEWEEEFKKYQQNPEFKIKEITLSEFKFIWHMEHWHRQWGIAIGACFLVPAVYFWARGRFTPGMKKRVLIFGTLTGAQGLLMGWYMVKPGLEERFQAASDDAPRMSQYRLASQLSLTFFLYTLFLWSALFHLVPAEAVSITSRAVLKSSKRFRMLAHISKGLIFLTAVSGVFVAGLDAGLVYNSFPKMADKWIPDDILALSPKPCNFTENPTTVQFDHRVLATITLGYITVLWWLSRKRVLPPRAYKAAAALAVIAYIQVALGITTLLCYVPVPLAISHQTGSLALLSTAIWLSHELKRLPK